MDWLHSLKLPLAVFLGGGLGALARWSLGRWATQGEPNPFAFPWITFGINVVGSFVLGLLAMWLTPKSWAWALLGVGVCGGFTTFSTFSLETLQLLRSDRPGIAILYAVSSGMAAVLGAWLGTRAAG